MRKTYAPLFVSVKLLNFAEVLSTAGSSEYVQESSKDGQYFEDFFDSAP